MLSADATDRPKSPTRQEPLALWEKGLELSLRFLGMGLAAFLPYLLVAYAIPWSSRHIGSFAPVILMVAGLFGLVATTAWTMQEHRIDSAKLHYLIQVAVRYVLALVFVVYGFAKFYRTQLYEPLLTWQDTPAGQLSGFELTWTFFGTSYPYAIFIGLSQVACAILLLFRKTQLLGALGLLPIVGNIVFVNFAYDIPVKLNASVFLVMAAFLVLSEFGRLKAFFWDNGPTEARRDPVFEPRTRRVASAVKALCIIAIFGGNLWRFEQRTFGKPYVEHRVFGIWEVDHFESDGDVLYAPERPDGAWTRVIFEAQFGGDRATLKSGSRTDYARYTVDPEAQRIEIRSRRSTFTGSYELVNSGYMILEGRRGQDSVRVELVRRP